MKSEWLLPRRWSEAHISKHSLDTHTQTSTSADRERERENAFERKRMSGKWSHAVDAVSRWLPTWIPATNINCNEIKIKIEYISLPLHMQIKAS